MQEIGWIKLFRKLKDAWFYKDSEAVHLWVHLLLSATHSGQEFMFNMKRHKLQKGQLITGRKILSQETKISESKIFRLLKSFENEQLIELQTNNRYSIITIKNWNEYQLNEHQNGQLENNESTTDEHQADNESAADELPMNTYNNDKNANNASIKEGEEEVSAASAAQGSSDFSSSSSFDAAAYAADLENWHGEFRNVHLTKDQYGKLLAITASEKGLKMAIEQLSANIGEKKDDAKPFDKNYPNMHFIKVRKYWDFIRKNPQSFSAKNENKNENNGQSFADFAQELDKEGY